jgi:hypothetical protein
MENFLLIEELQKGTDPSGFFRKLLVFKKYSKFDGKKIKGEVCYDASYKDFENEKGLKYTIYCYCYDYKGLVDNPENFEFCFEVQLNTGRGIIGVEAIQWDFGTNPNSLINIEFFEKKIEEIWEKFDSLNFPT